MEIEGRSLIDRFENPDKGKTFDDLEGTIADQLARFTLAFTDSRDHVDSLKTVCALGTDLWKSCGKRVCEDTSAILSRIVGIKGGTDMMFKFQQISSASFNNDICVYSFLALPTIGNDTSRQALVELCNRTIDEIVAEHAGMIGVSSRMLNFKELNADKIKELYNKKLSSF